MMRYCRKKITWSEFEAEPYREWHTSVMDDMEYRNMFSLFTKIKENGVKEFGEFCNVIPPASSSHLKKKNKDKQSDWEDYLVARSRKRVTDHLTFPRAR